MNLDAFADDVVEAREKDIELDLLWEESSLSETCVTGSPSQFELNPDNGFSASPASIKDWTKKEGSLCRDMELYDLLDSSDTLFVEALMISSVLELKDKPTPWQGRGEVSTAHPKGSFLALMHIVTSDMEYFGVTSLEPMKNFLQQVQLINLIEPHCIGIPVFFRQYV